MRKYWAILCSQIQLDSAYTAWYWASSVSSVLGMVIYYSFWHAVYRQTSKIGHMNFHQMITYSVVAMMLANYVSGVGTALAANIKNGSVAIELMRPYDLLLKLVAMDLGSKLTTSVRNALPLLLIGFLFLGVHAPTSVMGGLQFVFSAALGILIGTQVDLLVGVLAFWTVNTWGLRVLRNGILSIFSGSIIPLTLFPHWLLVISKWLPFASMVFSPVAIYTGTLQGSAAWWSILEQVAWLFVMYLIVRIVWAGALRKVVIFGG